MKHLWAVKHISYLKDFWTAFLNTDYCKLDVVDEADGSQGLQIVSLDPLPANIVLALGDAVHCMRCALDFTVSELIGWKNTRLTFPMGENREELISSFRTDVGDPCNTCGRGGKKGRNAALEAAVPGIGKFIVDEIRPYKASGSLVWEIGKLDARDKHRLVIPIYCPMTITGINTVDRNQNRLVDATAAVTPGGKANLMLTGCGGLKIESYKKPTAEIFINEAGIIQRQPLFPTLASISEAVTRTIDSIERFALGAGWRAPSSSTSNFP
ncbi:hypothetical protein [Rhizomicrobium electricum]|uniref:Uncharacterized protein n=1 Tax=Rhizomicrobium electricum TaxID=480070 RepID=A0ABP3Q4T2_9PROT|nr:hypothetical protein [Rhizomicrobium electricum]